MKAGEHQLREDHVAAEHVPRRFISNQTTKIMVMQKPKVTALYSIGDAIKVQFLEVLCCWFAVLYVDTCGNAPAHRDSSERYKQSRTF